MTEIQSKLSPAIKTWKKHHPKMWNFYLFSNAPPPYLEKRNEKCLS